MNSRWRRRSVPAALGAVVILAATLSFATPAWAHVTVHPEAVAAGSSDIEITFRVPNERDNASTDRLQVFFPTTLPLLAVAILPVPGWTATVDTRTLATPISTDDGPITRVVTDVTWSATTGGIAPGQYENFAISAGTGPLRPGTVVFKALQTYSSGEVVRWIQVPSSQDPTPDNPAPTLTVTPAPGAAVAGTTTGSTTAEGLAIGALVISLVALAGVVVLVIRGRRPSPVDGPAVSPDERGSPGPSI